MPAQLDFRPVALVTGAARGIGAATVAALVADGWAVGAVDACADDPAVDYHLGTEDSLRAVTGAAGQAALPLVADVRSEKQLRAAVAATVAEYGRLDAAVAVAGVLAGAPTAWETTEEAWQAMLDVNLTGVWRLAQAAMPAILAQTEPRLGRFVAVSSAAGIKGLPRLAAYAASKHGVVGLVRSMAHELGPLGVTANVICPGSTTTPILDATAAVYGLGSVQEFAQHHLLPRLLAPSEIAAAIAFLCGPGGSGITGTVLPVDAGLEAQ